MEIQISIFISNQLRATRSVSTPCVIGRSRQATLTIGHPVVSRRHCELFVDNDELKLRDVGSLNGTHFDSDILAGEVALQPGDSFRIGELTLIVNFQPLPKQSFGLVGPTPRSLPSLAALSSDSSSALAPPSSLDIIDLANLPGIIARPPGTPEN